MRNRYRTRRCFVAPGEVVPACDAERRRDAELICRLEVLGRAHAGIEERREDDEIGLPLPDELLGGEVTRRDALDASKGDVDGAAEPWPPLELP